MKIMVISDIHGSAYWCRKALAAFDAEGADKLLILGDVLYHGPRNDLPEEYSTKAVAELLNARREKILCVRGNCDGEVDQMMLDFPIMADYCLLCLGKCTIFATHGHRYHKEQLPPLSPGDILLHGHTHVPAWEELGENLYLNPGSISIPKENSPHSYMLVDEEQIIWKSLDGEEYHRL